MRTPREQELQIEIERLKAWLNKIGHEAWKDDYNSLWKIEQMAAKAIAFSSCACHPDWDYCESWDAIGIWPTQSVCDGIEKECR